MKTIITLSRFTILTALLGASPAAPTADHFFPLAPRQVKLGGELGRRLELTVRSNLLALDVERDFLAPFREKNRADGYVGLGKLIDATVRFAAYTQEEPVVALKRRLVSEAIQAQGADGYLGILRPESRMWTLWDAHEMSYLIYGLANDHHFFGERASLDAARRLADYVLARWTAEPMRQPGGGEITVHMAVTGLESAFLALAQETGQRRYLEFCAKFRALPRWNDRLIRGRWGPVEGHAYAHLCRCVAQLRLYRVQADARLLGASRRVLDFLMRGNGLTITGECGDHECWHDTQEGTLNLGESCATAYLVRFLDEQLRLTGDARCGDLMERALYNGLFAAQSPEGRRIRYYTPFDGPRAYFQGDTYCCPNNYRRIIAELPGLVFYHRPGLVAVNLYTASEATVEPTPGLEVRLRQETDYPASGRVLLRVEPARAASFALALRLPSWCPNPQVTLNGERVRERLVPGAFLTLRRHWKAGDQVSLDLPMTWRLVKGRQAQTGRVALLRGPQVYCLNRPRHPELAGMDLRLLVLDPTSVEGPAPDTSVRPGGQAARVRAWKPGSWYPQTKPELALTLTEFPDPGGEMIYLKVPDPGARGLCDDELLR